MVLVHSRKRNGVLILCIRSEVPFSKDAKNFCSTEIITWALLAFAELSSHTAVADALAGAGRVNCQEL